MEALRAVIRGQLDVDARLAEFLFSTQQVRRRRAEQHGHSIRRRPTIPDRFLGQRQKGRDAYASCDHDRRTPGSHRFEGASQGTKHVDALSPAARGQDLRPAADDPVDEPENTPFGIPFGNAERPP